MSSRASSASRSTVYNIVLVTMGAYSQNGLLGFFTMSAVGVDIGV